FHAGPTRGSLSPIDAADLAFIDDRRALLVATVDDGVELREATFEPALQIGWRQRIPGLRFATVSYRVEGHRWILVGYSTSGRIAHAEGTVAVTGVSTKHGAALSEDSRWLGAVAADAASALAVEERYELG